MKKGVLNMIENYLIIIGRKWFDKHYGNTYHSVTLFFDGQNHYIPFRYGYGDHYLQSAIEYLQKSNLIEFDRKKEIFREYCEKRKIAFDYMSVTVTRQRDL
jgi:hypothetical protein